MSQHTVKASCGCELRVEIFVPPPLKPAEIERGFMPRQPEPVSASIVWPCWSHGAGKGYQ